MNLSQYKNKLVFFLICDRISIYFRVAKQTKCTIFKTQPLWNDSQKDPMQNVGSFKKYSRSATIKFYVKPNPKAATISVGITFDQMHINR